MRIEYVSDKSWQCPICWKYTNKLYSKKKYNIAYCKSCHFGFNLNKPDTNRILPSKNPYIDLSSTNPDIDKNVFCWTIQRIEHFLGRKGRLLDIGCGPGYFLKELQTQGWDVEGVEIYPEFVELVNRLGIPCHLGDITTLPFPENSFDIISFRQVIEYIPIPPVKVLELIKPWLKQDGLIFINIANTLNFIFALRRKLSNINPSHYHAYYFSKTALVHIIREARFNILEICLQPPSSGNVKRRIGYYILQMLNAMTFNKFNAFFVNITIIGRKI